MVLSRDDILAAKDIDTREVDVPEWGGTVLVKALSGKERDAFESSLRQLRGKEMVPNLANARAKLVARSVVDEDGARLFGDNEINALGDKCAAALDRLFEVASEMSGLNDDDVEKLSGNSETTPEGDSTSTSPNDSDAQ
jgi:hypothetical protein